MEKLAESHDADNRELLALDGELAFGGHNPSASRTFPWYVARKLRTVPLSPDFPLVRHHGEFPEADQNDGWLVDETDELIIESTNIRDFESPLDYEGIYLAVTLVGESSGWRGSTSGGRNAHVRALAAAIVQGDVRGCNEWVSGFLGNDWDEEVNDADYS